VVAVTASKSKPAQTTRMVVLGSAKVRLAAGKSTTVKLTLNAAGKKLLAKHHTLKTKLAVTTKNGTKTQTLKTATLTFKATEAQGLTVPLAGLSVAVASDGPARSPATNTERSLKVPSRTPVRRTARSRREASDGRSPSANPASLARPP
jgi:hypothetical protein